MAHAKLNISGAVRKWRFFGRELWSEMPMRGVAGDTAGVTNQRF